MKKLLMALAIVGLLTSGCGNQNNTPEPKPAQSEQKPDFEQAVEPVKDAAADAKQQVETMATDAKEAAEGAAADAQNMASDAKDKAESMAADAQNMANDAKDAAAGMASDVVDQAKDMAESVIDLPDMISSSPSIGATREAFETYATEAYDATFDDKGRITSMRFNTPTIDNEMLAGILPSDVKITSFDTDSSDATKQVNHFQGTSEQLKKVYPSSDGRFEAFTNFDKQTSQFLGGSISVK